MRATEFIFERKQEVPAISTDNNAQVNNVKSDIIQKIQNIVDPAELNKIHAYVRKLDIGEGFESIFAKDNDLRQVQRILSNAIIEANGTFEEKMGFAKELVMGDGIINLESLFTAGIRQKLTDIVNTKYPQIFADVAPELLNIAGAYSAGGKKTNRGKGEFFLALLSPKISLSREAGDLSVNGKLVEVKSNLSRIKGRKGYGTTDAAQSQVKKNVVSFIKKNLPNVEPMDFKIGVGARSNFWNGEFGAYCTQQGMNISDVDKFIKEQLKLIVKSLYLDLNNRDLSSMLECVTRGVLNFKAFYLINKSVAFNYYKESEKFYGIIFIDSDNLDFIWCPDAETFQTNIKVKKIGYESGQQNGMQITL